MNHFKFFNKTKNILKFINLLVTLSTLPLTAAFADGSSSFNKSTASSLSSESDLFSAVPGTNDSESSNAADIDLSFVTVGDPGNAADPTTKLGAVSAAFQVAQYPVTAEQYVAFLNAVASQADPHGLYHIEMGSDKKVACITCSRNADGTFNYQVIPGMNKLPITYVSLNNAERFCNWLNNGAPTSATDEAETMLQQNLGTISNGDLTNQSYISSAQSTESGAYNFSKDANSHEVVEVNPNAYYFLPSQDQWVKAAYYKGGSTNAGYWMYPTQHDALPYPNPTGAPNAANMANYGYAAEHGSLPAADFLNPGLVITTVDCFSNTVTAYQACGMAGNVAEWTSATLTSEIGIVRGGSWASENSWYYGNDLMRNAPAGDSRYYPYTATNTIGFRIAAAVDAPAVSLVNDTSANGITSLMQANGGASSSWIPFLKKAFGILWPFLLAFAISFGVGALVELGALGIEMIPSLMEGKATTYLLEKVLTQGRLWTNLFFIGGNALSNALRYRHEAGTKNISSPEKSSKNSYVTYAVAFGLTFAAVLATSFGVEGVTSLLEVGINKAMPSLVEEGAPVPMSVQESFCYVANPVNWKAAVLDIYTWPRFFTNLGFMGVNSSFNTIRDLQAGGYGDPLFSGWKQIFHSVDDSLRNLF